MKIKRKEKRKSVRPLSLAFSERKKHFHWKHEKLYKMDRMPTLLREVFLHINELGGERLLCGRLREFALYIA